MNDYKSIDLQAALYEIDSNASFTNSAFWEQEAFISRGQPVPTKQEVLDAWETVKAKKTQEKNQPSRLLLDHLVNEGFHNEIGINLLLMRKLLKILGTAGVISTADIDAQPRLRDTYQWLNQQYAKAQAGNTNFDPKPYTFEELMAE